MRLIKRWKLAAVALIAAFVVAVTAGTASAAVPGESGTWLPDNINAGQPTYTAGTVSEARNAGNLMAIWRSNDTNGNIWVSINDGEAVQMPGSTMWNPVIVPYGTSSFAAFHTGNDSQIYMATFNNVGPGGAAWSGWHTTTWQSAYGPSVTQLGTDSTALYMTYRSNYSTQVLANYYNGSSWSAVQSLGGETYSAPTVTYNPVNDRIWAAHVGTDGHAYIQWQQLGSSVWNGWYSVGGQVLGPVGFAATSSGNMQMAARDSNSYVWYQEIDVSGRASGWTQDAAGWQTRWPIFLSAAGLYLYSVLTGYADNRVWYKQSFRG